MTPNRQTPPTHVSFVKLIIFGKTGRAFLGKSLVFAFVALMMLPSCKSHKLCEAYSDARTLKHGPVEKSISSNTISKDHTHPM